MAKYYEAVGFVETVETRPGVWEEQVTERMYSMELARNTRRLQASGQVNDDVSVANELSLLADPYASQNFHAIRYVTFMGAKWKVSNVEVQYPRLILTVGGVYHGGED
ncbi:MAG: hypothetical protein HFH39_11695 [Lachnospiraceae bacterium]|nr:hypothetical protein [Bacilli bacterium]MCI9005870.1 hypothetical protein [Lachnospiraceae bacterium]